jgi:hypothetical protein
VSRDVVEALVAPPGSGRSSRIVAEVLTPGDSRARSSRVAVDVLVFPGSFKPRVSIF